MPMFAFASISGFRTMVPIHPQIWITAAARLQREAFGKNQLEKFVSEFTAVDAEIPISN